MQKGVNQDISADALDARTRSTEGPGFSFTNA